MLLESYPEAVKKTSNLIVLGNHKKQEIPVLNCAIMNSGSSNTNMHTCLAAEVKANVELRRHTSMQVDNNRDYTRRHTRPWPRHMFARYHVNYDIIFKIVAGAHTCLAAEVKAKIELQCYALTDASAPY